MTNKLIRNQKLIDSFVNIMSNQGAVIQHRKSSASHSTIGTGSPNLSPSLKNRLPEIFKSGIGLDDKYKKLFNGDLSSYSSQSDADMALVGYLSRKGLSEIEIDQVIRASALYRAKWDELRGKQTYGERTIQTALKGIMNASKNIPQENHTDLKLSSELDTYKPIFIPNGMTPRKFAGPKIAENIRLFPENALSTLVALGAMGKTSLLMSIACHIASGKSWNGHSLNQKKVAIFFCEEDKNEINRKFSAITSNWSEEERLLAQKNALFIPLLGIDARLTRIEKGHFHGTSFTIELINKLKDFGLSNGVVIFDHMQGFTAGGLNLSETATALVREANKIVEHTKSAVIFAAHISKHNIKATEFEQGFAVGSLAFENGTRQMSGLISMSEEQAKKYKLEQTRKEYVWLSIAKNNYGSTTGGLWLKKVFNPHYHTTIYEPVELSIPVAPEKLSEIQKIKLRVTDLVKNKPFITKAQLDNYAGKKGVLQASKQKVREALNALIEEQEIELHKVTLEERKEHNVPKQVNEVLRLPELKLATMQDTSEMRNLH